MTSTTVITPTIGDANLADACRSVAQQTVDVTHLVVADGPQYAQEVNRIVDQVQDEFCDYQAYVMVLPFNTGANNMYGHRIYAAVPSLIHTEFFSFLDEDNWYAPEWAKTMQQALWDHPKCEYATCRRTIVQQDGREIGPDNLESVGRNRMGYNLYDTSTWMFRSHMSTETPWIAKPIHQEHQGSWGGDRVLTERLIDRDHVHVSDFHGTHYRSPERLYAFFTQLVNHPENDQADSRTTPKTSEIQDTDIITL